MKKENNIGEKRQVRKFAVLPVIVAGKLIWLKHYISEQIYSNSIDYDRWYPMRCFLWTETNRIAI